METITVTQMVLHFLIPLCIGMQDAFVYTAHPTRNKAVPDEHGAYLFTRILTAIALYGISWTGLAMIVSFGMCFPFLHNGMYYTTHNRICKKYLHSEPVYGRAWWHDKPQDSTAHYSFGMVVRTLYFITGVLLMVWVYLSL